MSTESIVVINGQQLTSAQAMVVRIAVATFVSEPRADVLGDDEMGRAIAAAQKARAQEVEALLQR